MPPDYLIQKLLKGMENNKKKEVLTILAGDRPFFYPPPGGRGNFAPTPPPQKTPFFQTKKKKKNNSFFFGFWFEFCFSNCWGAWKKSLKIFWRAFVQSKKVYKKKFCALPGPKRNGQKTGEGARGYFLFFLKINVPFGGGKVFFGRRDG